MSSRRDFLRNAALAGGTLVLDRNPWSFRASKAALAPLPRPDFYWGVGIENCWIAQVDPAKDGKRRLLDVYLQMQHYDRWKEDLRLAKDVGVNCIRYSVPWYKAEPKPGIYDWSWIDKPIDYLVNKLKIIPVMDLIHYGTPAWMADGVVDERYPEALGAYAGAMASHFKGVVNHYSPQNEPQLTCLFCGLTGRWPPYEKNYESWSKIGLRVARAMVLETQAIRNAISDAVIVSVDPMFFGNIDAALPKGAATDPAHKELRTAGAAYPASLVYGKVEAGHPFFDFLVQHGVAAADIKWVHERASKPDILGYNYYPDIFAYAKDGDFTRKGAVPLAQAAQEAAHGTEVGIRNAYEYFNMPIYLTETSAGLATDAKVAYMNALYDITLRLRSDSIPFRGINWWPLFDTIQWDYREDYEKPLASFVRPGGWNNGLYVIDTKTPALKRIHTAAADAYRAIIRRDSEYWEQHRAHG
jgi:beta-glucosidase